MVHKDLKIKASLWVSGGFATSQILRLASNLILTRLLVPEAFAAMAIVSIVLIGLAMFSDVGIGQSVIRHERKDNTTFFNTAWTMQVIRGVVLWLVCVGISVVLWVLQVNNIVTGDNVYSLQVLPLLISVVGLTAIIDGFLPTALFTNNRDLKMARITIIDIGTQVISLITIVVWAWISPTVWALVGGTLVSSTIKLILVRKYLDGIKNTFKYDKAAAAEILNFGKWIVLASMVTFLAMQGDRLLLGGLISARELGVYVIAFFMSNSIVQVFSGLVQKIWFPVFCEALRSSSVNLRSIYYKDRLKLDCAAFFIGGFLIASGTSIVELLYDDRYSDAGWMLEILSIRIALGTGSALGVSCLMALGISKVNFTSMFARTVGLFITVPICYDFYGLQGVIWAIGLNFIIGLPIIYWHLAKEGLFILKKELLPLPVLYVGYFIGDFV